MLKLRILPLALTALVLAGCGNERFDPSDHRGPTEPSDAPLMLSTAGGATTLPADGVSTLEIVARIAPEAVKDKRVIVFTTTGGSFVGATTTTDVPPDGTGRATVLLRASTEVGPVFVTAQVKHDTTILGEAVARMQIDFVQPDTALTTLSTVGGVTSLPADDVSTLELVVRISAADASRGRKIALTTSAGSLRSGAMEEPAIEVTPDASGAASVLLRSSTVVGPVFVTAQMKDGTMAIGAAAQLRLEFVQPDASEIIRFVEAVTSAPADGATASRFTVRISGSLPANQRMVTFRTTAGSFSAGDPPMRTDMAMAGADGLASILLYSPRAVTPARVTAEVVGFEATADLQFTFASTERIFVTIDEFTVKQDESAMVEVTLTRSVGTPSTGTVVEPLALDVGGVPFGVFTGDRRSDAMGKVTLEFRPDGGGTPGRAEIRVTAEGSSAEGVVEFELAPPDPP